MSCKRPDRPNNPKSLHTQQWEALFEAAFDRGASYQQLARVLGCSISDLLNRWAANDPISETEVAALEILVPDLWRVLNGVLDRYLADRQIVSVAVAPKVSRKKKKTKKRKRVSI